MGKGQSEDRQGYWRILTYYHGDGLTCDLWTVNTTITDFFRTTQAFIAFESSRSILSQES